MLDCSVFFIGVAFAAVLCGFGFKLGSTRGTWTTRVLAALGCVAALALLVFGPGLSLRFEGWILLSTFNTFGFCAGLLMASWLSSTVPEHNALLPENEFKPSKKAAALEFSCAAITLAMAGFLGYMFTANPVYHDQPGVYCLVVMLWLTVALLAAAAGWASLLDPQLVITGDTLSKWGGIWLWLVVSVPLIFGLKWLGALLVLTGVAITITVRHFRRRRAR